MIASEAFEVGEEGSLIWACPSDFQCPGYYLRNVSGLTISL
jgi:hypothetical protein